MDEEDLKETTEIGVLKCHSDYVKKLPEGAVLLGSSSTTLQELWSIEDRVLGCQSSPEFNFTYIRELIINKLYEMGHLDENQKNANLEAIITEKIP
jgi:GMP synthase-like glutamine amidotransferase